jgi:WD40 repeat protein
VSASHDKTVRVWNADGRGEPLVLRGHDNTVNSAAFSPDGRRIVSASDDKTVRVWNADDSGEPLVLRGHDELVASAVFNPDGRRIVSASADKTVRVWNADGTGELVILIGHDLSVMSALFSPDGRRVVSASADRTVRVWHDLAPVTLDDPRLWAATSYCMPIKRRIDLLGLSQDQAGRDHQNCLDRVERAHVRERP